MKCLAVVLFLVVAAVGDHCELPKQYKAGYLTAGSFKAGDKVHNYLVSGDVAVDMPGNRIWTTYNVDGHQGEVWLLYDEDTMYIRTSGRCYKHKIPDDKKDTLEEMKFTKNAHLLKRGRPADLCQRVKVYGAVHHNKNTTVHSLFSVTDSCILMSITFKVEGNSYSGLGQLNIFDVDLEINEKLFEVPSDCREISPEVSAQALKYRLFR